MKTIREYFQELSSPRVGFSPVTISVLDGCEVAAKSGLDYYVTHFHPNYEEQVISELTIICKLDVEVTSRSDYSTQIEVSWIN